MYIVGNVGNVDSVGGLGSIGNVAGFKVAKVAKVARYQCQEVGNVEFREAGTRWGQGMAAFALGAFSTQPNSPVYLGSRR